MASGIPSASEEFPEAADEYDSYLGPVAGRLRAGASVGQIAALLSHFRSDSMGLPADQPRDAHVAQLLHEWHQRSTAAPADNRPSADR